ncbi:14144_t:CDS:2 [Entrophospora sp. SA101]|nr:14144_t:CDS:2 [Entrophospora sp. SA101]
MPNANYPASKILQLNQNNTCYTYTIIKEGFYPPSDILQYTSLRSCNNSQFKIPDDYLIQTTWGRGSSSHTVQCEINYLEKAANFKICFGDNFQTCVNSAQSATDAANAYLKVAKSFAKLLNIPDDALTFSSGWLQSFKNRNNLKRYQLHGESGSADTNAIENALPDLKAIISSFRPECVYNMDETGLFSRQDKEHLTVVLCCNADGTDKLPPLIIGKFLKPWCMKNVNMNNLGITYRANTKAWMTAVLFQEWLRLFDQRMSGRKVLLLLDNAPCHIIEEVKLKNTQIKFLPPSSTSKIQPCDAGIIASFKKHYNHRFVHHLLEKFEDNEQVAKLNVLEAILFIKTAWRDDVTINTIANCWKHTGIIKFDNNEETEQEGDEIIPDIEKNITALRTPMRTEDFLNPVEENEIEEPVDEETIVQLIQEEVNENQNEEDDEGNELPVISAKEGLEALEKVMTFLLQQSRDCSDEIKNSLINYWSVTPQIGLLASALDPRFKSLTFALHRYDATYKVLSEEIKSIEEKNLNLDLRRSAVVIQTNPSKNTIFDELLNITTQQISYDELTRYSSIANVAGNPIRICLSLLF